MNLFQWESKYEIGLPKIDAQHQTLVEMLNNLYAARQTDQVQEVVESTLDALIEYTKVHFADEEAAMREAQYPYLEKHRVAHLDLADQVLLMRGNETATFELLNFLSEWLKFHIYGADREFGSYMRERNYLNPTDP